MRKIILLFIPLLLILSCYEGNPLDPAKGIDSQGDTTLFTGRVTDTIGNPRSGVTIDCYEYSYWSGDGDLIWSATTDDDGFYVKRYDLSYLSYDDIRIEANSGSDDVIIYGTDPDYDDKRDSHFDPLICQDFSY